MLFIKKYKIPIFLSLAILYLSAFLQTFPQVYIDEPWESITAYQLFFEGKLNNPILTGRDFYEIHYLIPRIVQTLFLGTFYKIFGLNLATGRSVSLLFAFAALIFFYKLLKKENFNIFFVFLGLVLLLTNNLFFIFARIIRPEIVMTCLGLLSFYLLYKGTTKEIILSGFFAGIGSWAHPNFAIFISSLFVIFFYEYKLKTFKNKNFWLFFIFFIIGLSPFLIYLCYEDFGNGFAHFWSQVSGRATQNEAGFLLKTFIEEINRYKEYAFFPYRILVVVAELFFLLLSFKLKDKLSRFAQIIIFTHVILFPLLIIHRSSRYFLPVIPFLIILILKNLQSLELNSIKNFLAFRLKPNLQKAAAFGIIILLVNQLIGNPVMIFVKKTGDYNLILQQVRNKIPKNSKVWGSMMFWFGFADCDYRTEYTYVKDLDNFFPDYVLTNDNKIWGKKSYISGKIRAKEKWQTVREKIENYVENYGELIGELKEDSGYGKIKIWKIDTQKAKRELLTH